MDNDFITRFLDNEQANLLLCDGNMKVTAVSKRVEKSGLAICPGQKLSEIFVGFTDVLDAASQKLITGAPFFSTNFEFSLTQLTVMLLPILTSGELSGILCCLDIPAEGDALPPPESLLPIISDRYRSPIAGVLNILSMFSSKFQAEEDYASLDYLNAAAQSCYRMLRSVSTVRNYFDLVNGKKELKPKWMDLAEFLDKLCQTIQVLLRNTHYQLECHVECGPIITQIDESLLSLAVLHLISNSCTYSPQDSTIRVSLARREGMAHITVTDEGSGIRPEDLDKIYEPFYSRHDAPVPEEEMGLGLGLPIARKVSELHGGGLFVVSEVNHGTTVAIKLPIREPDGSALTLHSDSAKYITNRFSDVYLLFSDICDLKIY